MTYATVLALYTLIARDYIEGLPIVPTQDIFAKKVTLLEWAAIILILIGFCYIVVCYIRLFMKAGELLWRNQLFLLFSASFIIMTIALIFINGFEINYLAKNRILLLFFMNIYTFYMQYMYSISKEERERVLQLHL